MKEETIISFGSAVRARKTGAVGIVEGYGVRFSEPPDYDCVNDRFSDTTRLNLDDGRKWIPLHFEHCQDPVVGSKRLAKLDYEVRPGQGLYIKGTLDLTDHIIEKVFQASLDGNMGFSSACAAHMVRRVAEKVTRDETFYLLTEWPIAEISLTPRGCDPQARATAGITLKHLRMKPLDQLVQMSGRERLQWERLKSGAALQRAIDAGEAIPQRLIRQFGLLDASWLETQRKLHAANLAQQKRTCGCGCDQTKVAESASMQEELVQSRRRGRALSMRIPQF